MYAEFRQHYFDERERERDAVKDRLVRRLKNLGFDVALTPQAA